MRRAIDKSVLELICILPTSLLCLLPPRLIKSHLILNLNYHPLIAQNDTSQKTDTGTTTSCPVSRSFALC
jgi:hypothetical protein